MGAEALQIADAPEFVSYADFAALTKAGKPAKPVAQAYKARVKVAGDTGPITFAISTEDPDHVKDVVSLDGWETDDFEANPVVLWCHQSWSPPVGNSVRLEVVDDALESDCDFSRAASCSPFAAMVEQMYRQDVLRAVSVGFMPLEYTWDDERKGMNFMRQALMEYSCCPVPMNPFALRRAKSKGIDIAPMLDWCKQSLDEGGAGIWVPKEAAESILKSLGPSRLVSIPKGDTAMALKRTTTPAKKSDAEQLAEATTSINDSAKAFKDMEASFGEKCEALEDVHAKMDSLHKDSSDLHAKFDDLCQRMESAFGDSDDDAGKATESAIRKALAKFPEALKAIEPLIKGGAPHKLSKANHKDAKSIAKAVKDILDRHGKTAPADDVDADDDDGDAEAGKAISAIVSEAKAIREEAERIRTSVTGKVQ